MAKKGDKVRVARGMDILRRCMLTSSARLERSAANRSRHSKVIVKYRYRRYHQKADNPSQTFGQCEHMSNGAITERHQ